MLSRAKYAANIFGRSDISADEKQRRQSLSRQRKVEASEQKQMWPFVFGLYAPDELDRVRNEEEIYRIERVCPRNVWMEPEFLFTQIKQTHPSEVFYSADKYCLAWRTGGSYLSRIPLDDVELQEEVFHQVQALSAADRKKLLFFFLPLSAATPVFAPKVHPASLVSYRTKTEVFSKLTDLYTRGILGLEELCGVLGSRASVWRKALYRCLPEDERIFHEYLTDSSAKAPQLDASNVSARYLDGAVPLSVFYDTSFPDRARKRDAESQSYPLPYETSACLVCGGAGGVIQCADCSNRLCRGCVETVFSAGRPCFLTTHRYLCMRRTRLAPIAPKAIAEPTYLTQLRLTGRDEALRNLPPASFDDDEQEEEEEEEEEEDDGDGRSVSSNGADSASDDGEAAAVVGVFGEAHDELRDATLRAERHLAQLRRISDKIGRRVERVERAKRPWYAERERLSVARYVARVERYVRGAGRLGALAEGGGEGGRKLRGVVGEIMETAREAREKLERGAHIRRDK